MRLSAGSMVYPAAMTTSHVPGFWTNETTGVLRPAVEAYLRGGPMSDDQVSAMRAYLRQWIAAPVWHGAMVDVLRTQIEALDSRDEIDRWLERAEGEGIDPL